MTGNRLWQVVIVLIIGNVCTNANGTMLSVEQSANDEALSSYKETYPYESTANDDNVKDPATTMAFKSPLQSVVSTEAEGMSHHTPSNLPQSNEGREQIVFTVGHKLFGDQQPHDHIIQLEAAERSDTAAMKTAAMRSKLRDDNPLTVPEIVKFQNKPKTFGVGHKLMGDQQLLEQLFRIESNEKLSHSTMTETKDQVINENDSKQPDAPAPLLESPTGVDITGIDSVHPEQNVNDMGPETSDIPQTPPANEPPHRSINTPTNITPDVPKPPPSQDSAEHLAPSGRRLVANKLYSQSSLPLVAGLSHDSAHLQVLTEVSQHHTYVHPPKVYPVTPSPELSGPLLGGPLLGGPRITSLQSDKKETPRKEPQAGTRFHRPILGRALFVDPQSLPALLDERTLRQSFEPVLYPRFYVVPYQDAAAEYRQRAIPARFRSYGDEYYN